MNRRTFVIATSASAAMIAAGCAPSVPLLQVSASGGRIRVPAATPELSAIGGMVRIEPLGATHSILLRRTTELEYAAVSMECMHLGCTIRVEGTILRCPCHGSAYDLDGRLLNGPAQLPLNRYVVLKDGGDLVLVPEDESLMR